MTLNKHEPEPAVPRDVPAVPDRLAKAPSAAGVKWKPVSGDLTGRMQGTAPNGARGCVLSAIGVGGGQAVYTGSEDGHVYVSPNAQVIRQPDLDAGRQGEAAQAARDRRSRSTGATTGSPTRRTPASARRLRPAGSRLQDPGRREKWADVTGNLPDSPVNSIILDPSYPNTLYAGTDVGPFVTYNGGASWGPLGSGFPTVAIWQLDLDTTQAQRVLAAGTHGRGAFRQRRQLRTGSGARALKVDAGVPVGPNSELNYTLTLKNIGNADATGVTITDPLPSNTSFVSASDGGTFAGGKVTWGGPDGAEGGRRHPGHATGHLQGQHRARP